MCNYNMGFFSPSYISYLDKSMMKWFNKYTYPVFMFVPYKTWPFGNEQKKIACYDSGILCFVELFEGKDATDEPPQKINYRDRKNMSLMLLLTKILHGTGKVVVLDSGFCVIQVLVDIKNKGVCRAAIIKKRRYQLRCIDGEKIKAHFTSKEDYVMTLMYNYGTNERTG